MPDLAAIMIKPIGGFEINGMMMPYDLFMPRVYNWCLSLGFETGRIMPSRAFCSDESQGYPIIMMAKHFGTFPFNHGLVGGVVATDRHGPHAEHGKDLVIIQASHVGYDLQSKTFGVCQRMQTVDENLGPSCGKIHGVLFWYQNEYWFAQQNILLHNYQGKHVIIIDNMLLNAEREQGLFLHLNELIEAGPDSQPLPVKIQSTSKIFQASDKLVKTLGDHIFTSSAPQTIGTRLSSDMFYFRRNIQRAQEGTNHLEYNLIRYMPQIITSKSPMLTAAQITTQIEFDRTFRSIVKEHAYNGKKVLFISGLNIDVSHDTEQLFPQTQFVPWAAFVQDFDGTYSTLEQEQLVDVLSDQSTDNPNQIDLEKAIDRLFEPTTHRPRGDAITDVRGCTDVIRQTWYHRFYSVIDHACTYGRCFASFAGGFSPGRHREFAFKPGDRRFYQRRSADHWLISIQQSYWSSFPTI